MEGWVKTKSDLISRLIDVSALLELEISQSNWDAVEQHLQERARSLRQLNQLDEEIGQRPSPQDQMWMTQLAWLQSQENEIYQKLRESKSELLKELDETRQDKIEVMEEILMSPKGQSIEIRV